MNDTKRSFHIAIAIGLIAAVTAVLAYNFWWVPRWEANNTWVLEEGWVAVFFEDGLVDHALEVSGRYPNYVQPNVILTSNDFNESIDFAVNLANYIRSVPGGDELDYFHIAEVLTAGFIMGWYEEMYRFTHQIIWDLTYAHSTQHLHD